MNLVTVEWPNAQPRDLRPELEAGNILYFPKSPFDLPEDSQEFLRGLAFSGGAVHKNIAYRPASDRVTGFSGAAMERVRSALRDYSRKAVEVAKALLPAYAARWTLDYSSFRPLEEQGRDLPTTKRNDLIHTDAFPSRPTFGSLILRFFANIHPTKTRVWITSDPFADVAPKHAPSAGLNHIADQSASAVGRLTNQSARLLHRFGLPVVPRSAYDRFMLAFHDYLKHNDDFQANCSKHRFEFPPGSAWMVFTDVVPHSVESGQFALEQTFIVPRDALANAGRAPISILESLCGRNLQV